MTTARAKLREALSERLVPALLAKGFRGPASLNGNSLVHEYRRSAGALTHVLGIQFAKNQGPRFVVNLHVEPPEGIDSVMARGGTIVAGRLTARPGPTTRAWFRADRSWWERTILRRQDTLENEAADLCASLLPEVEAWWAAQKDSAHISSWPVKYAARDAAGG